MRFNQATDLASQRTMKRSVLGLFTALLCMLFAAGCSGGGDNGGFIASPGGGGAGGGVNAGNGSVTFNFVRQQTNAIIVPLATVNLRFEFFTGLNGTGAKVKTETRPFAGTITIDDVPSSVNSSMVTALSAETFPQRQFTSSFSVTPGGNTEVSALSGNSVDVNPQSVSTAPLTVSIDNGATFTIVPSVLFTNGETVVLENGLETQATFIPNDPTIATVDANGLITGVATGTTSIQVNFQGNVITIPVSVGTGVVAPPTVTDVTITAVEGNPITLPVGAATQPVTVTAFFDNMTNQVVTQPDVTFNTTNPNITVDANGMIAVATTATAGETASITATFNGFTSPVPIVVTVSAAQLAELFVAPTTVSLPFGQFEQVLTITGRFTDGSTPAINLADLNFDNGGSALYTVDATTATITSAAAGTQGGNNLTITSISVPTVSITVAVTIGDVNVIALSANPTSVTLGPGGGQDFVITATLSAGTPNTVDVSNFASLVATTTQSGADTDIVANGNTVVAVSSTVAGTPAMVTFSLPGAGPGGTDAMTTVNVTVLDEFVTSARYFFGGIEITDTGVNLPRGYVGIIEVVATFNTGVTRTLNFNEYTVTLQPQAPAPATDPNDMIRLFNSAYAITPPAGTYTDDLPLDVDGDNDPANATVVGAGFSGDDAVVDDIYGTARTANAAASGSSFTEVATRDTFRGIAADWPRGAGFGNVIPDASFPVAGNVNLIAPGAVDIFNVTLDASVVDPLNPTAQNLTNITCTITDPVRMTYGTTGFVNYPDVPQVPVGTVREFEVRVNFDAVTIADTNPQADGTLSATGPRVQAITGWKLAEANILITSASGGANPFATQAPTALGFAGVTSPTEVQVNNLTIRALPLAGTGVRPILLTPPTGTGAGDDYVAGTYISEQRVFGPIPGTTDVENPAQINSRDPGPASTDRAARAPADTLLIDVVEPGDASIDFVTPLLFTIDPINNGGPLTLSVGASQLFRTLVQFDAGSQAIDMSLDYEPTLVAAPNPNNAFTSRGEGGTPAVPGRVNVSAVNATGNNVDGTNPPADNPDVLAATGFGVLNDTTGASDADVTAAINAGVQAFVVAIDVAGTVIPEVGNFTDQNNFTGPAQSVTTLNATP